MVKLYDGGVYPAKGTEIFEDAQGVKAATGQAVNAADASKGTMA